MSNKLSEGTILCVCVFMAYWRNLLISDLGRHSNAVRKYFGVKIRFDFMMEFLVRRRFIIVYRRFFRIDWITGNWIPCAIARILEFFLWSILYIYIYFSRLREFFPNFWFGLNILTRKLLEILLKLLQLFRYFIYFFAIAESWKFGDIILFFYLIHIFFFFYYYFLI